MHKIMKKTCEALEDIEQSNSLNIMDTADRKLVSELVDLKKNILKAQKLEDEMAEYSGRGYSSANRGQHYVRGHYSHDSMHDGEMGYSSRRDSRGRYSRDDGRSEMMEHIEMAMDVATPEDREMIKRFMQQIERA